MSRKSANRIKAFELWKESGGDKPLVDIAAALNISPGTVRGWKAKDKWEEQFNGTLQDKKRNAPERSTADSDEPAAFDGQCVATALSGERCRLKAMPGSKYCRRHANAVENQCTAISKQTGQQCRNKALPGKTKCKFHGGASTGPPPGSQNNLKHGFFAKIFPDDEETMALVEEIMEKSPLDILWENIMIQYLAIARAQKIAWVQHQDDITKVLKRTKESENMSEEEWEIQHAWDKHHAFLAAQSKAMSTLERLIGRYEELLQKGLGSEEHQLRITKLKSELDKLNNPDGGESKDWVDALLEVAAKRKAQVSANE